MHSDTSDDDLEARATKVLDEVQAKKAPKVIAQELPKKRKRSKEHLQSSQGAQSSNTSIFKRRKESEKSIPKSPDSEKETPSIF